MVVSKLAMIFRGSFHDLSNGDNLPDLSAFLLQNAVNIESGTSQKKRRRPLSVVMRLHPSGGAIMSRVMNTRHRNEVQNKQRNERMVMAPATGKLSHQPNEPDPLPPGAN